MQPTQPKKQISFFVSLPEYLALRAEAARNRLPVAQLCLRWMRPHLNRLEKREQPACP